VSLGRTLFLGGCSDKVSTAIEEQPPAPTAESSSVRNLKPDSTTITDASLIVVSAAVSNRFARVTFTDVQWTKLAKGELMFSARQNHKWSSLPVEFTEMSFAFRKAHNATAKSEITKQGWLCMAIKAVARMNVS
jgi:hypothetical protein